MQGNSKYLRWSPLYTCCCILVVLSTTVIAVPVRSRRMVTETYPAFDAVSTNSIINDTKLVEEKCFKDGKEVLRSVIECETKPGCKAIQKTGECCPDYQCDCSHEGGTYKNGERVINPDPCRRCTCKGGEVTCSEISCYIRDDCKPKYAKGVCCPSYDNCPPLDDAKIAASKESDSSRMTTSKNDAIMSLTTMSNPIQKEENNSLLNFANENPLGIKIIEITKPEEIRITDDKPKAFKPKFSTTTTTTQSPKTEEFTKSQTTDATSTVFSESTTTDYPTSTKRFTDIEDANLSVNSNERENHDYMDDGTTTDDKQQGSAAPPTKETVEGEVEPELSLVAADANTIGDESSNKSVRQTVESSTSLEVDQSSENTSEFPSSTTESEIDSFGKDISTTTTVADEVAAMSVTHMPKNIIIVRQGGKTESFHILGTDGLQRVEELDVLNSTTEGGQEDSSEAIVGQSSEQSTVTSEPTQSSTEDMSSSESPSTPGESFGDEHTVAIAVNKNLDNTLQLNESSTEHLTNNSIEVSTTPSNPTTEDTSEVVHETVYYPEEVETGSTEPAIMNDEPIDTVYYGPTEENKDGTSTTETIDYSSSTFDSSYSTTEQSTMASTTIAESTPTTAAPRSPSIEPCGSRPEDEESTLAENPEFPYVPDDLSIHCKQIEEEEKRRLPSKVVGIEEFDSSTVSNIKRESPIGLASSEVLVSTVSPSDEEVKNSHEMDLVEARAPGEPLLIPEWERNTTESNENPTNEIKKTSVWDNDSMASIENSTETGSAERATSSSEEKYGNKEPTTSRSTTKRYSDDIENGEEDLSTSSDQSTTTDDSLWPKDDAESIKFDSEAESSAPVASYEGPSFKFIDLAMKDSWRTWAKENDWPF